MLEWGCVGWDVLFNFKQEIQEQRLGGDEGISHVPLSSQNSFQNFSVIGGRTWEKWGYSILAETRSPCFNFSPIHILFLMNLFYQRKNAIPGPLMLGLAMSLALVNRTLIDVMQTDTLKMLVALFCCTSAIAMRRTCPGQSTHSEK